MSLALRIVRRYARRRRFLRPLQRVFLRPRELVSVHRRHDHHVERLTVAPRYALTVAPRLHVTLAGRHEGLPAAVRRPPSVRAAVPHRTIVERSHSSRLVERIERRSTRVEREYVGGTVAATATAGEGGSAVHNLTAAPPARALAPRQVYLQRLPAPARGPEPPSMPPAAPSQPAPPRSPEADLEVARLTDRVLTAIDARLLAERERLGRP